MKSVHLLYGKHGMELSVPDSADILESAPPPPLHDPARAVRDALASPIGSPPLAELLHAKRPSSVAITISDITRPVPNRDFLPLILSTLNDAGVPDKDIAIVVGTGMHRPSTPAEHEALVGADILRRIAVIDHRADARDTLVQVQADPPVRLCRRFAEAGFRIVTGFVEPHFMAGFSGGRKGVCPALVDLETVQRFHGYETLANPLADNGVLDGNPCHKIALSVAKKVGVDFLFNVAVSRDKRIAGVYCGDLDQAHLAGCRDVAKWTTAEIAAPYDLVVTSGGGYPLDQTFYQTVKGMCTALPALDEGSVLLQASHCGEGVGSTAYEALMLRYANDWRRFMADIAAAPDRTELDQWEFQMQCRVLERIGRENLWFATDGIPVEKRRLLALHPVEGEGDARARTQKALDDFISRHPKARVAVVPDGPYTMLKQG